MKKSDAVQLIIDAIIIVFGLCMLIFPGSARLNPNNVFTITMGIYAFLELLEYIFDRTRIEPLCLFFSSGTAAFSSYFLREYSANYVLSITIAVWAFAIAVVKFINFKGIYEKKTHLFIIRLAMMSSFTLFAVLVSINLYYRLSTIMFMLAFMYMGYGILEIFGDFCSYLSENVAFLKE